MKLGTSHRIPTLLYVDDNADDRRMMELLVEKALATFHLSIVDSLDEAVDYVSGDERFQNRHDYPEADLVLLDFDLGKGTAVDFLLWRRKQPAHRRPPVAVFSGTENVGDFQRCVDAGADACLQKPRDNSAWEEIVAALQQCLCSGVPNLEALGSLKSPTLVQLRLRRERGRLLEQRRAISRYLDAVRASQKDEKRKFPFPARRCPGK